MFLPFYRVLPKKIVEKKKRKKKGTKRNVTKYPSRVADSHDFHDSHLLIFSFFTRLTTVEERKKNTLNYALK